MSEAKTGGMLSDTLVQAQEAVLGAMLIDPEIVGGCLQRLRADDFVVGKYKAVYYAIRRVYEAGNIPDPVTVNNALGGNCTEDLIRTMDVTGTTANWEAYADMLSGCARLYRLRLLGEQLMDAEDEAAAQALVDRINAISCAKPGLRITTLQDCYRDFLDRHAEGKQPAYLTWGVPALDDMVYVERGDMLVLGGYPSAGKTALALQLAYHMAQSKRVGYFYLENNDKKLFDRLVASQTLVPFGRIKRYDLGEDDFKAIVSMQGRLTAPVLEFVDASGMTVQDVRSVSLSRHYDVAVVDYLQKLRGGKGRRGISDFERVSEISSDLQDLGKQTGVTVLALSQLTRPEKKNGKTPAPGMHSFRQSGQIEQDADVALLLYKNSDDYQDTARTLKIGKNKEGMAGVALSMLFDGDTQTFSRTSERVEPARRERQKPRQVSFWDGWREVPDEEENPFREEGGSP